MNELILQKEMQVGPGIILNTLSLSIIRNNWRKFFPWWKKIILDNLFYLGFFDVDVVRLLQPEMGGGGLGMAKESRDLEQTGVRRHQSNL